MGGSILLAVGFARPVVVLLLYRYFLTRSHMLFLVLYRYLLTWLPVRSLGLIVILVKVPAGSVLGTEYSAGPPDHHSY